MTRFRLTLLLLLIPASAYADDLDEVIGCLGVSPAQFDYLWSTSCDEKWQQKVPLEVLENTGLIAHAGIASGMLEASKQKTSSATLKAGPKCGALQNYYGNGQRDEAGISNFIDQDRLFIEQYGYSALDAWGVKKYQSASMNGKINEYELGLWRTLEAKGLITLSIEDSTFNGKPSRAYFSSLTQAGKALNETLGSRDHSAELRCPSP